MRQDPISHNTALPLPLTEGHNHFIPQLYNILYPDTAAETHYTNNKDNGDSWQLLTRNDVDNLRFIFPGPLAPK